MQPLSYSGDESVLKSITGKARSEFSDLVRNVTGASSLRISTPAEPSALGDLLDRLLALYSSEDYKQTFPDVARIRPINDRSVTAKLDTHLLEAIFDTSARIVLSVPEIVDYSSESWVSFAGAGRSDV